MDSKREMYITYNLCVNISECEIIILFITKEANECEPKHKHLKDGAKGAEWNEQN